ncbi:MAG TPA: hypothetical protein VMW68_05515 [Methyloceanibacter sp.]|nr:hypothetical protein [Methyloceanibacter sp.]
MARLRPILALILAAAVSLGIGLAIFWLLSQLPCEGEQLSCNIDDAIGGYGTMIWAGLGLLVFGIALLFTNKRTALTVAALLLIAPLIIFVGGDLLQGWRYVGLYPYADFRSFIAKFAPPAIVVLVQYLILRVAVARLMG